MQLMPVPQPPPPISARCNQPTWWVVCVNLGINEAEERTAGDDLGMGVMDKVTARSEACCADALGAGGEGEDGGVQWVLRRGEQEGGEDSGLTPLRLALLGECIVLAEGGRGDQWLFDLDNCRYMLLLYSGKPGKKSVGCPYFLI